MDDAVRKAFTDLTVAIAVQAIDYSRGKIACQDTAELETDGCEKCALRDTCCIVRKASVLQAEAKIWLTTDGIDFMQSIGLRYEKEDIEKLL